MKKDDNNSLIQTSLNDIGIEGFRTNKRTLSSNSVPREGNPQRILDIVEIISRKGSVSKDDINVGESIFNDSLHLGRLFKLIDEDRKLTNRGRGILQLEYQGSLSRLSIALCETEVFQTWMKWGEFNSISEIKSETAENFLNSKCKGIKKTTVKKRSTILRRLLKELRPHHPSVFHFTENINEEEIPINLAQIPVFGDNVIDVIKRIKHSQGTVRISTGWMTAGGYDLVARNLEKVEMKILLGSDDIRGFKLLTNPIEYFKKSINYGVPTQSKRDRHYRLYRELISGSKRIKKLSPRVKSDLHAKGYFFGRYSGLPTSANMTFNGLINNVESGLTTSSLDQMEFFIREFEDLWDEAEDITTEIVEIIEESWILEDPVAPYLAYLRGLLELYGKISGKHISEEYELANFQEMIVASSLHSLNQSKGILLISPTGTGKTIMGSYIVATKAKEQGMKVLVFAPNKGIAKKWEDALLSFSQTSRVWSHQDILSLSNPNAAFSKQMSLLVDGNTLVVVDECHRFRTEGRQGEINLRRMLNGEINGNGRPNALLLTATPMSVGFENLKTIHSMISENPVESIEDVPNSHGLVNVTMKFIIDRFGIKDENGHTYLEYPNNNLYFAHRYQTMKIFTKGNEDIYSLIQGINLTRIKQNNDYDINQESLDNYNIGIDEVPEFSPINDMELQRINLARAVDSSKSAILKSIDNMLLTIKNGKYLDPLDTREGLENLKLEIKDNYDDRKFENLLDFVKQNINEKILIFVGRKETRNELVERLRLKLKGKNIHAHDGTEAQKLRIRENFAPIAHGIRVKKKDRIDILVGTDSLSEGFDLQDATIAIDYDLWWTPLQLIQRMGRLDRPTTYTRSFEVVRFVNQVPEYSQMVKMDKYLSERSLALKELIADAAYEHESLRNWEITPNESLGVITARTSSLDELDDADFSTTSNHLADLASSTETDKNKAKDLSDGFVTSLANSDYKGTFSMFSVENEMYVAFLHINNGELLTSFTTSTTEFLMSIIRSDKDKILSPVPTNHYSEVKKLIIKVSQLLDKDQEKIKILFSAATR